MNTLKQHLQTILQQETENLTRIQDLLQRKQKDLQSARLPQDLSTYTLEFEALTNTHEQLQKQRDGIIELLCHDYKVKNLSFPQLIEFFSEEEHILFKKLYNSYKVHAEEIKALNEANKAIIHDHLSIIRKTIQAYTDEAFDSDYPQKKEAPVQALVLDKFI